MSNRSFTINAEEQDDGTWQGELVVETDGEQNSKTYDYDDLHELVTDMQTDAIYTLINPL